MAGYIGQVIDGRYRVEARLGIGGMAEVYRAYDIRLKKEVALKFILSDAADPQKLANRMARFEIEARKTAALSHPNIIAITDFGRHEDNPFLVMDYLPAGSLQDYIDRRGSPLSWQEAARFLAPVARALAYAHAQGIIHRDVKPANILLGSGEKPILADFGIAKVTEDSSAAVTVVETKTGIGIGTLEYMPPEQAHGKPVAASDQYALGMSFYYLVTGRTAFKDATQVGVLTRLLSEPPPSPRQFAPGLPAGVEQIILKGLSKKAAERFPSMEAFAVQLEQLAQGQIPPSRVSIAKARMWAGGIALVFLLAVVLAGIRLFQASNIPGVEQPTATFVLQPSPTMPTFTPVPVPSFTPTITVTLTRTPISSVTPSPIPSPEITSTKRSPLDGMLLLYVPEGNFKRGSINDGKAQANEFPQQTIYLDAYWIDQTEISNKMYALCVAAGVCKAPSSSASASRNPYYGSARYADYPVIYVSWEMADTYCRWTGRRLPTEAEWEKAARGIDGRTYPWGEEINCEYANYAPCNIGDTTRVDSYPAGKSIYGTLNMAGNVSELVADWYKENYYTVSPLRNPMGPESAYNHVSKGGQYNNYELFVRSAIRGGLIFPNPSANTIGNAWTGFRCAVSP